MRRIAAIADEIWREYWTERLPEGQAEYMINRFCTYEAEVSQIENEGCSYYFIKQGGRDIGYTVLKPDSDGRLFLSKLYLYKEERGKGCSRQAMERIFDIARRDGHSAVWLTVNKHNDHAIAVYKALGFTVIGEGVTDIGGGYVMDDYYLEARLPEASH
ncbi:MAG: GNAT family N-acetyltransferase [Ruminococcus sp.]|nr:GNAT family N-acetyltransferase [Ruminococcus sp.]